LFVKVKILLLLQVYAFFVYRLTVYLEALFRMTMVTM